MKATNHQDNMKEMRNKGSVCSICHGFLFDPDNAKRQYNVRTFMKHMQLEGGLPNQCAGSMSTDCLCPYQKR